MSQPPFPGQQPYPVPPSGGQPPHQAPQPLHPGQPPVYPGQPPAYPGQPPAYPGQPPAYPGQPFPQPATRSRWYRPSKGLAVVALVVGGVWTLVELVEAVTAWSAADTYAQAARDGVPAEEVITSYDVVGMLWTLVALGGYVAGCLLLWRLRSNAEVLSAAPHARSSGWVWGGWLVPFVALWFPYQVVRDIRRATAPHAAGTLVGWWWAFYLLSSVTTVVGPALVPVSGTPSDSVAALGRVETVDAVLVVVSFVLWCLVVLKTVAEQERAAKAATASFMPPWAAGPPSP